VTKTKRRSTLKTATLESVLFARQNLKDIGILDLYPKLTNGFNIQKLQDQEDQQLANCVNEIEDGQQVDSEASEPEYEDNTHDEIDESLLSSDSDSNNIFM